MGENKSIDANRVVEVDFATTRRRVRPAKSAGPAGMGAAPRPGRAVGPDESTLRALAQLIAEKAAPETLERDIASICRLLGERCRWSAAALIRLSRAAEAAHAMRMQTTTALAVGAAGRRGEPGCDPTATDHGRRPAVVRRWGG